jgi:hypothetical protein
MATAHVSGHGDMTGGASAGVGVAGQTIEGFSLAPIGDAVALPLEYRIISTTEDDAGWSASGSFVGTRGRSRPLFGFAVRLRDDAAREFTCLYAAEFAGGETVGPLRDGAACRSATGAPLEALRVAVRRR